MPKCDICCKDFTHGKNLKRHLVNVHKVIFISKPKITITKESKHKCPLCQLAFVERSSLRRHERLKHQANVTAPLRIKK